MAAANSSIPRRTSVPRRRNPLDPYPRCTCGLCRSCIDNAKWDRVFAKFATNHVEVRGVFQSTLRDL